MKLLVRVFVTFGLCLWTISGIAHAAGEEPIASEPRPRQELTASPGWVTLVFGHEVDPGVAKLVVTNSRDEPVTIYPIIVEGTNMTMQLAHDLPKDTYTVHYRVNRAGGGIAGGSFQFSYGKGQWTANGSGTWQGEDEEPPVLSDTDPAGKPQPSEASESVPDVVVEKSDGPDIEVTASTPTPSSAASEQPTAPTTATAEPEPNQPTSGNGVGGYVALGAVLVAGVLVGLWFWRRRKN